MATAAQKPETIPSSAVPAPCAHASTARACTECGELVADAHDLLCVPFAPMPEGYHEAIILRLDLALPPAQRVALRALLTGLMAKKARTGDGRLIQLPQHAVAWLLENLEFIGE